MAWFDTRFNNRYSGVRRPVVKNYQPKNPVFSFSVTGKLIVANVIAFLLITIYRLVFVEQTLLAQTIFMSYFAIQPLNILSGMKLWTLITHMFMHADLTHLLMNMISLAFIGSFVEKLLGRKRFFWLYFIGGLIAATFFIVLAGFFGGSEIGSRLFGSSVTFAVGASGAIFALGGLLAMLTPKMKVLVFFVVPMPMWLAMTSFMGIFWLLSFFGGIPIGNSAHLGGLVTGLIYGVYLKIKYPKKTRMIARVFS